MPSDGSLQGAGKKGPWSVRTRKNVRAPECHWASCARGRFSKAAETGFGAGQLGGDSVPREAGLGASGNFQVSWRRGLLHAAFAYCKAHTTFSFLQCFSSVKNCLEVICI